MSTGVLGGQPSGTHGLARAASLGEQGKFRVAVERVYPMSRAAEAHAAAQQGPRRGKIVLAADWDR
ncbi:MAG: zinc-binding dehydrogenase [Galbitalea sp.]